MPNIISFTECALHLYEFIDTQAASLGYTQISKKAFTHTATDRATIEVGGIEYPIVKCNGSIQNLQSLGTCTATHTKETYNALFTDKASNEYGNGDPVFVWLDIIPSYYQNDSSKRKVIFLHGIQGDSKAVNSSN